MSNCCKINDRTGDKTKTYIITSTVNDMNNKIKKIDTELNIKIANIHKKFKGTLNSKLYEIVKTNKNNIGLCVLERQKNDRDIDSINTILKSNKEIIKQLLKRCEYLEENMVNIRKKEREENNKKQIESIKKQEEEINKLKEIQQKEEVEDNKNKLEPIPLDHKGKKNKLESIVEEYDEEI